MAYKKSTIISDKSDKPKAKKEKHYVSNSELYEEFVKWNNSIKEAESLGKDRPQIPNSIGLAFVQIATNLARKSNWLSNSKWIEEMIGDGIEDCVRYAHKFDVEKSKNPFSYFTQTSYYAFLRRILKEKKNDYVKHKSMLNALATNADYMDEIDDDVNIEMLEYNQDNIEQFIRDFEKKNFGEELALDETAGNAGKRREIKSPKVVSEQPTGFF